MHKCNVFVFSGGVWAAVCVLHFQSNHHMMAGFSFNRLKAQSNHLCKEFNSLSFSCVVGFSQLTVKLSRNPQVDDQSFQGDTGTLKFAQHAQREGDKFHPSALKYSFTAVKKAQW